MLKLKVCYLDKTILNFTNRQNVINKFQFGFCKGEGKSTKDVIIKISGCIHKSLIKINLYQLFFLI